MSATVDILLVWKKGATAEEWLLELAAIARKFPERFELAILVYQESLPNGNTLDRQHSRGANVTELLGLLEIAKYDLQAEARR